MTPIDSRGHRPLALTIINGGGLFGSLLKLNHIQSWEAGMQKRLLKVATLAFSLGACFGSAGNAAEVLTAAGSAQFTLSTFADSFPTTGFCCGPLGIAFPTTG